MSVSANHLTKPLTPVISIISYKKTACVCTPMYWIEWLIILPKFGQPKSIASALTITALPSKRL